MVVPISCRCGRQTTLIQTSWTPRNPGRRFYVCSRRVASCGFVDWYDPPMCDRAVAIIPGLLRAKNKHEETIRVRDRQVKQLKFLLGISWIIFVVYIKMMANISKSMLE